MAESQSLIDFDIIETQKENIQSLSNGRSAKSLAQVFSPIIGHSNPSHTQSLNDAIRAEYEKELTTIDDSDDPLDIYDRYVRWTLNAYPSAQATTSSQLLPLLERATKAFLSSDHYKNDSRYLKLWLHHIRFFSDSPRETFAYLARHGIGMELSLYYEEFGTWLEGANRWIQADEVYQMGLQRGSRPTERLARKYAQFQKRAETHHVAADEPRSPAVPTVRPALATKLDPFSPGALRPADPQAQVSAIASSNAGPKRQRLRVFADDDSNVQPALSSAAKGWGTIESSKERKKENIIAARPWAGEKLSVGVRQNIGIPKMPIFKDQSAPQASITNNHIHHLARDQESVNKTSGKLERIFVNLERVYPAPNDTAEEYCFEELRAVERGWLGQDWSLVQSGEAEVLCTGDSTKHCSDVLTESIPLGLISKISPDCQRDQDLVALSDENRPLSCIQSCEMGDERRPRRLDRANRTRKIKVTEVKNETQTVQTNLSSPKGPKMRRRRTAETTMTLHTKAATDEIYEIFNEPLGTLVPSNENTDSEEGSEEEDDEDYTSADESTGTGCISDVASECDETTQGINPEEQEVADAEEESSDDTTRSQLSEIEHTTDRSQGKAERDAQNMLGPTQDLNVTPLDRFHVVQSLESEVMTPITIKQVEPEYIAYQLGSLDINIEQSRHQYRSTSQNAQRRLPFMTPIVEKTESSLGTMTAKESHAYFDAKTPCPRTSQNTPVRLEVDDEICSSPFQDELIESSLDKFNLHHRPIPQPKTTAAITKKHQSLEKASNDVFQTGPAVDDMQCNPMDPSLRKLLLESVWSQLMTFEGFYHHANETSNRFSEIRKYSRAVAGVKTSRNSSEKTASTIVVPPILKFEGSERQYAIQREVGAGAFAPVYLVEVLNTLQNGRDTTVNDFHTVNGQGSFGTARHALEAIKTEEPPSPWEFYIIRTLHRRLGVSRASHSIVQAYEMHLYDNEGYLVEEYCNQGTLLDLVNAIVQQNNNGSAMDESLAMFFMVELIRTVEGLHSRGIIHCDLKADNVLVRLPNANKEMSAQFRPDGSDGWSSRGITLIDLGRGIDMRAFRPDVQFTADWETSATDCAEMREMRPWTYHADYHGLAAIAHTMLFGRYIETIAERDACAGVAGGKTYRLKEGIKRYWQSEIWNEFFGLALNPGRQLDVEDNQRMPCLRGMKSVRESMEAHLVATSERSLGLRTLLRKAELLISSRKKA